MTRDVYNIIKMLDKNIKTYFGDIAKYAPTECYLQDVNFSEDEKDIIIFKATQRRR